MKKIPWLAIIGGVLCTLSLFGPATGAPQPGTKNDPWIVAFLLAATVASWITAIVCWPQRRTPNE